MGGLRSPHLQYSLIHSVVILGRGSSQISDLHLQSPISNVVILGGRIRSDLRSPSPISNLQSRFGGPGEGGAQTFKEMRYGFIHTAHLRSPISNLPFDPCRRQLRSPISNLDLQSPPQWWMPGARIYDLCSPSPISPPLTLATAKTIHNL